MLSRPLTFGNLKINKVVCYAKWQREAKLQQQRWLPWLLLLLWHMWVSGLLWVSVGSCGRWGLVAVTATCRGNSKKKNNEIKYFAFWLIESKKNETVIETHKQQLKNAAALHSSFCKIFYNTADELGSVYANNKARLFPIVPSLVYCEWERRKENGKASKKLNKLNYQFNNIAVNCRWVHLVCNIQISQLDWHYTMHPRFVWPAQMSPRDRAAK